MAVLAGWASCGRGEQVAPGVVYSLYEAAGPNRVHVVTIDRLRTEYKLEVGWAQGKRNYSARENTSTIAGRYNQLPHHPVLAAINGSFIDPINLPNLVGTVASHGQILAAPQANPDSEYDTFIIGASRMPIIRSAIRPQTGRLTFANGVSIPLDGYNRLNPPIHTITAYTPGWDTSTRSSFVNPDLAVEIILENVTYPMRGDKEISGVVGAVRTGLEAQNNVIPQGGMVLTGWGSVLSIVLDNVNPGDRLRMYFATSEPWYNTADMAIAGIGWILHQGEPFYANWDLRPAPYPYARNPRTVLAWSEDKLIMMVCDGRWPGVSEGMTFAEVSNFLITTFNATGAVNLDGGGSSTMWVDGWRRNSPEGGSWERPIGNAVLLVQENTQMSLPFTDTFGAQGRQPDWDDKFCDSPLVPFSPTSPGGDGYVLRVLNPDGGSASIRHGNLNDAAYTLEADVYCEYRPDDASMGFERCGLFARDSGTAAFDLVSYGGGNAYVMAHDTHTGQLRAGKFVDGQFIDFIAADPVFWHTSDWRRFRIECYGSFIRYTVDGQIVTAVRDTTHSQGFFGVGHREYFSEQSFVRGTRVDNLSVFVDDYVPFIGDFDFDGDVDQGDFGHFQRCLTGTNQPQSARECLDARLDEDTDVDAGDFAIFHSCLSGTDANPPPECRH